MILPEVSRVDRGLLGVGGKRSVLRITVHTSAGRSLEVALGHRNAGTGSKGSEHTEGGWGHSPGRVYVRIAPGNFR